MSQLKFSVFIFFVFTAIACKKQNPDQLPVEVSWDRDVCTECGMVISDHRYAAQIINREGRAFVFDDIGCAVNWLKNKSWKNQARIWISDFETQQWIDVEKAYWRFGDPNTPMGYGFVATMQKIDSPLEFNKVRHQIENDQTLKQKHLQKHGSEGHQIPKDQSAHSQDSGWKTDSQTMPHENAHGQH
ncbi:MAG: nitrous oxide reductase accessory protein NosL [SAR324 cluster bacterium]|nr:nitrous oxide reductase accessory protein NosL [SAR324 cluster bacterium]